MRPTLFTEDGICAEIYSLFIDFDIGTRDRTDTDRNIFHQTLEWMWSGVEDRCRSIAEFRDRYRDDATALAAIEQFATTQVAKSKTQNHPKQTQITKQFIEVAGRQRLTLETFLAANL